MKVSVFGTGYVGLVQAAVLAEVGHEVCCVDIDVAKIAQLKAGEVAVYEPDLEGLVRRNISEARLRFTTEMSDGIAHGDVQFIAVATPQSPDGSADLRQVFVVAQAIATQLDRPATIVNKSTVPVGTADRVRDVIAAGLKARAVSVAFDVVSNPEFLKEGSAVADCMRPDRIILGTDSPTAERRMRQLYAAFNRNHEKIIVMDARSAELTKYAANAMLATRISFMNEIANIAETVGADIEAVRKGIGSDPRIGYNFIYPGIGYGGSCFPKDMRALIHAAESARLDPQLLKAVEVRNEAQKQVLVRKAAGYFGGDLKGRTLALWGLSFKPNTSDMREAPARAIMAELWAAGAGVRAYDPKAMPECARLYGDRDDLVLCRSKEEALEGADALIIATEWKAFQAADVGAIRSALRHPAVFDGRNIYDPSQLAEAGIDYFAIGRGKNLAN